MEAKRNHIKSKIKNEKLIDERRKKIVNAAVKLFVKKGYHETTVREIADEFGMSMGALYDYIRTKEDILFLVCDHIHKTISDNLKVPMSNKKDALDKLKTAIERYFTIVDEIQDYMLLLYQETKSLSRESRKYIFSAEKELTAIFENILYQCIKEKSVKIPGDHVKTVANNIMVMGQMWTFRRWVIQDQLTLGSYIKIQTELILKGILRQK